jgi:putative oxidoreductase
VNVNAIVSGVTAATPRPTHAGRGVDIALWVLQILLVLAFVVPVYRKFAGVTESVELFDELGFGQWLRYAVGLLELVLALCLLVPAVAGLAAIGLVGVMAGAIATEVYVESGRWLLPLVLMLLAAVVAIGRRERTVAMVRRVRPAPAS